MANTGLSRLPNAGGRNYAFLFTCCRQRHVGPQLETADFSAHGYPVHSLDHFRNRASRNDHTVDLGVFSADTICFWAIPLESALDWKPLWISQ